MKVQWRKMAGGAALAAVAVAHAAFAWSIRDVRAEMTILDPAPSPLKAELSAFGDHQFLYRVWGFNLQNAGDTGGRATRMVDYDYGRVIGWLTALQRLNLRSHYHTYLAAKYFALTAKKQDVRSVLHFIAGDVALAPDIKWYWLTQAMATAEHELGDTELALQLAQQLASYDFPDMPTWTWFYPAVLLEKLDRVEEARTVVAETRQRKAHILNRETLNWLEDFEYNRLRR